MKRGKIIRYKKAKQKPPKCYDSWLEYDLHCNQLEGCEFHPDKIQYSVKKRYEPDFKYVMKDGYVIYFEAKGRFRDSSEASKYIWIRDTLNKNEELIFIFSDHRKPMPNAKKRKDGTKITHGEWAERNGFRYYRADDEEILKWL